MWPPAWFAWTTPPTRETWGFTPPSSPAQPQVTYWEVYDDFDNHMFDLDLVADDDDDDDEDDWDDEYTYGYDEDEDDEYTYWYDDDDDDDDDFADFYWP